MTNIPKPMNPYAETDFDNAVDNALNEMSRREKHTNKAVLTSTYYMQEVILALIKEGYELTLKRGKAEDEVIVTWGDK